MTSDEWKVSPNSRIQHLQTQLEELQDRVRQIELAIEAERLKGKDS